MATSATRAISIAYTGDHVASDVISAEENIASPGVVQLVTLAIGNNTISVPTGGSTPKACSISKPPGNTTAITWKGVAGDTGVRLHDTDPDSISIHSSVTSFVLHAAAQVVGVRLWWT